jgi:multiple sugar transport system substrate-binding protein
MRKHKLLGICLGTMLIAALVIPAAACSSSSSTSATTSATTTATTTKTTTATTTTSATTTATTTATTATTTTATTTKTTTATTTQTTTTAAKPFGLASIPEIKNRASINIPLETGGHADALMGYINKFAEATGIDVTVERLPSTGAYSKEIVELRAGTGAYDIIMVESSWTNDIAKYCWKLTDLAQQFDPGGVAAFNADLAGQDATNIRTCADSSGNVLGLPYYTYTDAQFIREDVFNDTTEKTAFKAKYGYDLAPAETNQQLYDQGEFFTRKKGDLLKGQPLANELYGLSMMAGAYQINDEVCSRIWGKGSDYYSLVRDANGKVIQYVITKKNKAALKQVLEEYKAQLPFCSPGCLTANFDFCTSQFAEGITIIIPNMYTPLDQWAWQIADKGDKTGRLMLHTTVGGRPYLGSWSQEVTKDSKNPEAAYWMVRYLASYEAQLEMGVTGGFAVPRRDVMNTFLTDPMYQTEEYYRKLRMRSEYLLQVWEDQKPYVDNYVFFNCDGNAAIYEQQIFTLNKAITGEMSVDAVVALMTQQTLELQRKTGDTPITEEV